MFIIIYVIGHYMAKIQIKKGKNIDFPSQSRIYIKDGSALSGSSTTTYGKLNLPFLLGILNRKSYQNTTTEGVPLVYRVRATYYMHDEDADALSNDTNLFTNGVCLDFKGAQSNWTVRNAAVKWHAAREAMRKAAGVTKKQLGAYADCIRYSLTATSHGDVSATYYLKPMDGDGNNFTGGTWDHTLFTQESDESGFNLHLAGYHRIEESGSGGADQASINMIGSYLQSRVNQENDTNAEANVTPTSDNYLNRVFQLGRGAEMQEAAKIIETARGEGDNPPYEPFDGVSDGNHDTSEPVRLARLHTDGGAVASGIIDIPFGLSDVTHRALGQATGSTGLLQLDVLNIYEMMG